MIHKSFLRLFMLFLIAIFLVGCADFNSSSKNNEEEVLDYHNKDEFHVHARFTIVSDGEVLDFSDIRHMYLGTCGTEERDPNIPLFSAEKIHLHDNIGNVAHIHAKGTVWRELFESLRIEDLLENEGKFFYESPFFSANIIREDPDLLDREVAEYESVIFVFSEIAEDFDPREYFVSYDEILFAESSVEGC